MACEYTKGPWKFDTEGGDYHIRSADGESLMCDMQYYPWAPKNVADWHLIAAAPELLEALKQIERETIDHVAVKTARAAIAKAEGK